MGVSVAWYGMVWQRTLRRGVLVVVQYACRLDCCEINQHIISIAYIVIVEEASAPLNDQSFVWVRKASH